MANNVERIVLLAVVLLVFLLQFPALRNVPSKQIKVLEASNKFISKVHISVEEDAMLPITVMNRQNYVQQLPKRT